MSHTPPMPPPLGAMAEGLRYQLRHFWLYALLMLYPQGSDVAEVEMECRDVKAVDDLKVLYHPPGINDDGTLVDVDYLQIKFHVSQADYVSARSLITPAWTGTREPMLKRFWLAWKELRHHARNPRLILRTNWPWDPDCPLTKRRLLRDDGRLNQAFFTEKDTSEIGRIRSQWEQVCDASDREEFGAFLQALRFQTSARLLSETEEALRDRCRLAGTRVMPAGVDWNAYDDLGKRLLERGHTWHTPESLRQLLGQAGLLASEPQNFAGASTAELSAATILWPPMGSSLSLRVANHGNAQQAFQQLLCPEAPYQLLRIQGASQSGKTHLSKQFLGAALGISGLRCGRFDFKGSAGLDREVNDFAQQLNLDPPPPDGLVGRLTQILLALKKEPGPTLLIFDTFEMAGEADHWVRNNLLFAMMRSPWLRLVIGGQGTAESRGEAWETRSSELIQLTLPTPEDWWHYGISRKPDLKLEFVREAHACCKGNSFVLAELLWPTP